MIIASLLRGAVPCSRTIPRSTYWKPPTQRAASACSHEEHPDICVLDINLPTVSGFELARRILGRDASARIIMFSMNDDPVFAARAIEIGAKGYVSKSRRSSGSC